YNIDMTTGPIGGVHGHGAIGIYVDGARNITVERNKVHECDRGIGIVSENDLYPTSSCIVRNNFVYNNWRTGIYLGGYLNYTSGGTNDCYVVNNTLYQNNIETGAFGEIEGEIRLTERCNNNVIKNNIIYARPVDVFVHKYTSTGVNNVIDNNLYYTTGTAKWIWNGTEYTGFAAWKTACGGDVASTNGIDPLLVNKLLPDLHIQAGSPAKHTGVTMSEAINGNVDIDGNPRIVNNKISKGAQQ
ncbi:MAG TPA: right-handed parallel beta-helix repeat-containing protein, partial [Niastella sp.]